MATVAEPIGWLRAAPRAVGMARLFAGSGRPFGVERSVRLRRGRLESRRLLLSQSRANFGPAAWTALGAGVAQLGLAESDWAEAARDAAFLHLGHEADAPETCKLYVEHAVPSQPEDGTLVHSAWKWRDGAAPRRELYRYVPAEAVPARLAALAAAPGTLGRIAAALVAWLPDGARPFGLDVRDAGEGARASLDLRLYDLEARITDLGPFLIAAMALLELPPGSAEALLAERGHEALGHVALGSGADGAAFLTIYGGAVGVAPECVP